MLRFLLFLLFIPCFCFPQISTDSLKRVSKNSSLKVNDRVHALILLTDLGDIDDIEAYAKEGLSLLSKTDSTKYPYLDFVRDKIHLYANLGYFYRQKNAFNKAQAMEFYTFKLAEKIRDEDLIAQCRYNLGMSYYSQEEYHKALDFLLKSLPVFRKNKDEEYLIPCLISIGVIYQDMKNYNHSIYYYRKAIAECLNTKKYTYLGMGYTNLAVNYTHLKQYDSAVVNSAKGMEHIMQQSDSSNLAWAFNVKANIMYELHHGDSGTHYSLKSMEISKNLNQLHEQKTSAEKLFYHYRAKHDYEKALNYYLQFHHISDSIINDENRLLLARNEIEYEFIKKEEKLLLESQKTTLQFTEERKRDYIIIFSVIAILAVSLFFGYMVFKSLKLEKQARKIVLEQKEIIEEKQKEIIDSINYAKSLQEAILPPMTLWKSQLPESFILYKPKDIVAGDFYWMEKSHGLLFFAVADCTGHGVPGAMVSVVCSNALNRSVLEFKLTDPGEILDKTRELVISTFEKSEKQVRDGMDISLCVLNSNNDLLQWAGANNPLCYIHNKVLTRISGNKQPVGEYGDELPFTTHTIQLHRGDNLYLFSDGYADQFGGPKGKKFKYKQLEEVITGVSDLPMQEQATVIDQRFESWKGNLGQVDDVCIIGIRICGLHDNAIPMTIGI
jgi:serine phosphatase RsbU (regulator of sigma subunit)